MKKTKTKTVKKMKARHDEARKQRAQARRKQRQALINSHFPQPKRTLSEMARAEIDAEARRLQVERAVNSSPMQSLEDVIDWLRKQPQERREKFVAIINDLEPMEIWVNVYRSGNRTRFEDVHADKASAEECQNKVASTESVSLKHFVEVYH